MVPYFVYVKAYTDIAKLLSQLFAGLGGVAGNATGIHRSIPVSCRVADSKQLGTH